jgi:curved DNA-binding protein CbpA
LRRTPVPLLRPSRGAFFHTTAPRRADVLSNHYETLELPTSASPAEIKRQFYTLSKKNHPDHNRDDPEASTRFVAISEAYHTLSVPEKRRQYDVQLHQSKGRAGGPGYPQGSYSSAAYGSRPASGLNKKRSTFRGPPPSFYKSGGYGKHGAKRTEHAYSNAEGKEEAPHESYGDFGGGYGPGQQKQGYQVPHFNDKRHKETHDSVNEHIWARRRRTQPSVKVEEDYRKGDMLINFVVVSGVIGFIGMTLKIFGDRNEAKEKKRRDDF